MFVLATNGFSIRLQKLVDEFAQHDSVAKTSVQFFLAKVGNGLVLPADDGVDPDHDGVGCTGSLLTVVALLHLLVDVGTNAGLSSSVTHGGEFLLGVLGVMRGNTFDSLLTVTRSQGRPH